MRDIEKLRNKLFIVNNENEYLKQNKQIMLQKMATNVDDEKYKKIKEKCLKF